MTPAVEGAIDTRMRTLNPFRDGICRASGSAPGLDLVTTKSPLKIAQYRICLRRVNPVPDQLRMATLTPGGRISTQVVDEETSRLSSTWHKPDTSQQGDELEQVLTAKQLKEVDVFDRAQLAFVTGVCARSRSLSEAGRSLFGASRTRKSFSNDADRLRKYPCAIRVGLFQDSRTSSSGVNDTLKFWHYNLSHKWKVPLAAKSITEVLLRLTMSKPEHLAKLMEGGRTWNQWREESTKVVPDLGKADLSLAYFDWANLTCFRRGDGIE